jgi:transposase
VDRGHDGGSDPPATKPGSRIKTDRRDARKLGELFRAGLLTEVHPPSETDEALRDLCRCRDDVRVDLLRARHRLSKFLLRRHLIYRQTKHHWGTRQLQWLEALRFDDAMSRATFDSYFLAVQQLEERQRQPGQRLAEFGSQQPYREPVAALRCFKGIDTVTAVYLGAELHDFRRFHSPRQLAAYVGLVPSEHSSGEKTHRGRLTRTGNGHVRRILIESAWAYRYRAGRSARLRRALEGQPAAVVAISEKAEHRLTKRYARLIERGKARPHACACVARELCGFVWAMALADGRVVV